MTDLPSNHSATKPREFHVHLSTGEDTGPLPLSFEEAQSRLENLDRLYFEPDGSFVWAGRDYQVFGMLYDAAGQLQYVELRGKCPLRIWKQLVECFQIERASVESDAFGRKSTITVMVLPHRQRQELQSFETLFFA